MPKFVCKCEYVIDLSPIPCPDEYVLVKSTDWEKLESAILNDIHWMEKQKNIKQLTKSIIECSNCGRFWLFNQGFSNDPDEYVLVSM